MNPSLAGEGAYRVALLGEALGADEAEVGQPFVGKAGFKLSRLIEWAGLERGKFDIYNSVWCRPPDNKLDGTAWELPSISHCRAAHWNHLLQSARVVVPMGNVPTGALLGRKGILTMRGYLYDGGGQYILPTVHPAFIARGQAKWSAAFINDLQKAVEVARNGVPPQVVEYLLDPSPLAAYRWAKDYRAALVNDPSLKLAFDIETPGKSDDEDDLELSDDAPDRTWNIERVGFSYRGLTALSVPWEASYRAAIHLLLGSSGDKVVWNAGFDVPRIRRAGVEINGLIHDAMVAWHILHSDLPKSLRFVATFTCPFQPAWKHLSGSRPAYYNATDADVELRSMDSIEMELRRTGLWEVYTRDVLELEPILVHMQTRGMPVDLDIRMDRAVKLSNKIVQVKQSMLDAVPVEARRIAHVYKKQPADTTGLSIRPGTRSVPRCSHCGHTNPGKAHFKSFKKKLNPCAGAGVDQHDTVVDEYYRLAPFSPSRDQLIRYHQHLHRHLPMAWDKQKGARKVSFGERQIKDLTAKYPDDILYKLILEFRKLDKIAGTYIGRPSL